MKSDFFEPRQSSHILSDELIDKACAIAFELNVSARDTSRPFGGIPHDSAARRAYKHNLTLQLGRRGIRMPNTNLFPERPGRQYPGSYLPGSLFHRPYAMGFTRKAAIDRLHGAPSEEDIHTCRAQVALHEMAHHISFAVSSALKDGHPASWYPLANRHVRRYRQMGSKLGPMDRSSFSSNIRERQAEGSSYLYLLSNYEGNLTNYMRCMRTFYETDKKGIRVTHNYQTTLRTVLEDFVAAPQKGLDLVQCVEHVSGLIDRQRGLGREQHLFVMAQRAYFGRDPAGYHALGGFAAPELQKDIDRIVAQRLAPHFKPDALDKPQRKIPESLLTALRELSALMPQIPERKYLRFAGITQQQPQDQARP